MGNQGEVAHVGEEFTQNIGNRRCAAHIIIGDFRKLDDMFGDRHQWMHKTGPERVRYTIHPTLRGNLDNLRSRRISILARGLKVKDHIAAPPERLSRYSGSRGLSKEHFIGKRCCYLFAQSPAPALTLHKKLGPFAQGSRDLSEW